MYLKYQHKITSVIHIIIAGRLCEYTESQTASTIRETCNNGVEDYLREVTSEEPTCETGTSASFTWTPDENTPNEVYYQV